MTSMKRNPQNVPIFRFQAWLLCLCTAWLLASGTWSEAQPRATAIPLADISHSAWTARDGAPTDISSLAQTTDGYLWIGTSLGLYRFDGLKFSNFPSTSADPKLPSREISALATDEQNGLWVGFSHGGLAYVSHGAVTPINLPDPYKGAAINGLQCCSQQSLWVTAGDTILRWDSHKWENIGERYKLPRAPNSRLFLHGVGIRGPAPDI